MGNSSVIDKIVKLFYGHCVYTILVISSYLQEIFGLSEISLTDNRYLKGFFEKSDLITIPPSDNYENT